MLTFNVKQIKHLAKPDHLIISVAGMPFYQSSGVNSANPDTWFPFFGLIDKDGIGGLKEGDYIKPIQCKLDLGLSKMIMDTELARRFWKLPCLWVSSEIGGGFWRSQKGIKLKTYLDHHYFSLFPGMLPKLVILPITIETSSIQVVNTWLCERANVQTTDELPKIFPETLLDLGAQLEQNEKNNSKLRL